MIANSNDILLKSFPAFLARVRTIIMGHLASLLKISVMFLWCTLLRDDNGLFSIFFQFKIPGY